MTREEYESEIVTIKYRYSSKQDQFKAISNLKSRYIKTLEATIESQNIIIRDKTAIMEAMEQQFRVMGIIDMDYRDEIKMVITNYLTHKSFNNGSYYSIKKGDKIGQLILKSHHGILMPSEYTKDAERVGGFGSSGS